MSNLINPNQGAARKRDENPAGPAIGSKVIKSPAIAEDAGEHVTSALKLSKELGNRPAPKFNQSLPSLPRLVGVFTPHQEAYPGLESPTLAGPEWWVIDKEGC